TLVRLGGRGDAGSRTAALQPDLAAGMAGGGLCPGATAGCGRCLARQPAYVALPATPGLVQGHTGPTSTGLAGAVGGRNSGQRYCRGGSPSRFCLWPSATGTFV